ncbi:MAG: hypothetical protein AAFW68_11940 [Pseudomonadota bacterium]
MKKIATVIALLILPANAGAQGNPFKDIQVYDRADWARDVTDCDRLAAHPGDPEKVSGGLERADIDLDAAIAACGEALESDPENPRLNYQLARVYGYSGQHQEGDPYRTKALNAGYPQSLFVVGYIRLEGWDGRGKDVCYGGELIRRSAQAGRFAGLVGFPHYALNGVFDDCTDYPRIDFQEMTHFLERAEAEAGDYYQRLLIVELKSRLSDQ